MPIPQDNAEERHRIRCKNFYIKHCKVLRVKARIRMRIKRGVPLDLPVQNTNKPYYK